MYQSTRKETKEIVQDFFSRKASMFSNTKRSSNAIEDKIIDALYHQLSAEEFRDLESYKKRAEEILICVVEKADKYGFVKIIYDFVFMCSNNY